MEVASVVLVVMSASKITTRGVISCDIIDQPPSQFNYSSLPTNGDVLKAWNWERIEKRVNGREPSWKQIRKFLVSKLEEIWARASIPTVSTVTIDSSRGTGTGSSCSWACVPTPCE